MASLASYVNKKVVVLTADSRVLAGTLVGCDQQTNLILKNTEERIIRPQDDPEPSTLLDLGVYVVRGDNVCTVGLMDEQIDDSIDWTKVRGEPIGDVKHI